MENKNKDKKRAELLDKDFIALCKKHNMKRVMLVSQTDIPGSKVKDISIGCYVKGGKGELAMSKRVLKLLRQTGGISNNTMKVATDRLEQLANQIEIEKSFTAINKLMTEILEHGMTDKDKAKLKDIRDKKTTLCARGEYEQASKLREEEKAFIAKFGVNKLANVE